jgi:hypothetical protein
VRSVSSNCARTLRVADRYGSSESTRFVHAVVGRPLALSFHDAATPCSCLLFLLLSRLLPLFPLVVPLLTADGAEFPPVGSDEETLTVPGVAERTLPEEIQGN